MRSKIERICGWVGRKQLKGKTPSGGIKWEGGRKQLKETPDGGEGGGRKQLKETPRGEIKLKK